MPGNTIGAGDDRSVPDGLGPDSVATSAAALNAAAATGGGQTVAPQGQEGVRYKTLKQAHPSYDADYWRECRALYEGGKALLRDHGLLRRLFPRHRGELEAIYTERRERAFFVPYPAEIIGHVIAGVSSDPVVMEIGGEDHETPLPDFYQHFCEDVSPEGGETVSLNELLGTQLLTALQTGCAWTLADLPKTSPEDYDSAKAQEESGALNAFAVSVEPECVLDWQKDSSGELRWALVYVVFADRDDIQASRSDVVERWTYYTPTEWKRYEISHPLDKPPNQDDVVPLVSSGLHSFGRVPLIPLEMPPGFWAMDKLHSIAKEHFNKRSALSWAEFQHLFQELYEFLDPTGSGKGATIGGPGDDDSRAVNQRRGQGFVQQRAAGDRAEFIGPSSEAFAAASASCDGLRDDMHRVMHQMALAAANTPSALKRSAESKQQDVAAVEVVLGELGRLLRKHATAVCNMVSRGRLEKDLVGEWVAKGASEFDAQSVSDAITDALSIDILKIPSETFRRVHFQILARRILGDKATPEQLESMERELEENITAESIAGGTGQLGIDGTVDPSLQPGASLQPGGGKAKRGRPGAPAAP